VNQDLIFLYPLGVKTNCTWVQILSKSLSACLRVRNKYNPYYLFSKHALKLLITPNSNKGKASRRVLTNLRTTQKSVALSPPSLSSTFRLNNTIRFINSSALAKVQITDQDILDLLCSASAATVANQICDAFRIRKVKVWSPMTATLVPVTATLEWSNTAQSFSGDAMQHSDTSMGSTCPAFISCKPPKGSLQDKWSGSNVGTSYFALTCPANSVIDFTVQLRLRDGSQVIQAVTHAVAGATVGQVYCRALDSNTGNVCVPASLLTI